MSKIEDEKVDLFDLYCKSWPTFKKNILNEFTKQKSFDNMKEIMYLKENEKTTEDYLNCVFNYISKKTSFNVNKTLVRTFFTVFLVVWNTDQVIGEKSKRTEKANELVKEASNTFVFLFKINSENDLNKHKPILVEFSNKFEHFIKIFEEWKSLKILLLIGGN